MNFRFSMSSWSKLCFRYLCHQSSISVKSWEQKIVNEKLKINWDWNQENKSRILGESALYMLKAELNRLVGGGGCDTLEWGISAGIIFV